MRIVIKRHGGEYQVYRICAIAQAIKASDPSAEVFVECFDEHKEILSLFPSLKWKNPHHPYAVGERGSSAEPSTYRPAAKLYDEMIDLDADSPLELEFTKSGLKWWTFILEKLQHETEWADSLHVPDFPAIEAPLRSAPSYVLIAPISAAANPAGVNVNRIEERAKALYPGEAIRWASHHGAYLGPGRTSLKAQTTYLTLASLVKSAKAIFAVNGIVAAMAKSLGHPNLFLVRSFPGDIRKDIFAKLASNLELDHPQSLSFDRTLSLSG